MPRTRSGSCWDRCPDSLPPTWGLAIVGALGKLGSAPEQVQYVIMGQVLTAGAGQNPARRAAAAAGIPMRVPAMTINEVCLSGLNAIAPAGRPIRAGELNIVVAGGQESMTRAPHILEKSRQGFEIDQRTNMRTATNRTPADCFQAAAPANRSAPKPSASSRPRTERSPTITGRVSALRQLVLQAPAPVVADALGIHYTTAHRHRDHTVGTWNRYTPGDHSR